MHLLFLTHYFPPEVNAPATRTYEHCRRWVAAGHQVTVITCAPNCPRGVVFDGYENAWRSEEIVEGIRVIRVWTYLAANEGFARRIANFVSYMFAALWAAMFVRRVDVMVATSPQFFCGWAGVLCHWLRRWPFVLEIRDIWPESILAVGAMKRSLAIRVLEWLERRMYAAADLIVTVGDGYRKKLLERGVSDTKIAVIPNGVDASTPVPRQAVQAVRAQHQTMGKFVCAYIGTVGMAHGLDVVLDAAEHLRSVGRDDVQFWIVGDGADRQRLETEARRRQLDNIRFLGLVSKAEVATLVAAADCSLVHLRKTELFGTVIPSKIFETMEANTPIIMGVVGESRDIVLQARAGVAMEPGDARSLLICLDQIAARPTAYQHGRDFVRRFYNRDDLANLMRGMLEEVAGVTPAIASQVDRESAIRRAA